MRFTRMAFSHNKTITKYYVWLCSKDVFGFVGCHYILWKQFRSQQGGQKKTSVRHFCFHRFSLSVQQGLGAISAMTRSQQHTPAPFLEQIFLFTRLKAHPGLPEGSRSTAEVSVPVPLYPPSPSRVCWAHPQHRWFTSASPPSARCLQLVIWPLPVQQTSQFTWLSRVTSIQPYGVKLLFLAGFSLLEEAYLLPVPSLKDGSSTRGCNQASSCLWIPYWPLSPFISAARLIRRAVLPPPGMQTGRGANLKALCARHFVTSRL